MTSNRQIHTSNNTMQYNILQGNRLKHYYLEKCSILVCAISIGCAKPSKTRRFVVVVIPCRELRICNRPTCHSETNTAGWKSQCVQVKTQTHAQRLVKRWLLLWIWGLRCDPTFRINPIRQHDIGWNIQGNHNLLTNHGIDLWTLRLHAKGWNFGQSAI